MNNARTRFPIHRYLNVENAYFPGFTADGERITFLSSLTGLPQLWQTPAAAPAGASARPRPMWPEQLTFGQNRVMGAWPAPTSSAIVFARDVGGNEKAQLFLLYPERAELVNLTAGHEEAMHTFGCWAHDGSAVYFSANRRDPAIFDIYRLRVDGAGEGGAEAELLWEHDEPGYLVSFTLSPDGRYLAFSRMQASFEHDLFELELESGEARRLSEGNAEARYYELNYAPGEGGARRTLYLLTDLESDFLHLRSLRPATMEWETLFAPEWDVEMLAVAPTGRYLAVAVNMEGAGRLELLDMGMGMARPGPNLGAIGAGSDEETGEKPPGKPASDPRAVRAVPGMVASRITFSPDGGRVAFAYTAATRTYDVYVWDIESDDLYPVTGSGHGGLPLSSFVAPELVRYPSFDGREIPAWFYKPSAHEGDAERALPVVIIVHGGPESQFRPYFHAIAQYLVASGYAVFAPNVRGSTGYGKRYSHLDDVEKRMDSVADLAEGARWLAEQPEVDGECIAVYGGSYGGFMVLSAITTYPDLWAAAVDIVGISNFVTFLENTSDYRRGHRESEYGSLEQDREFLESIAPIDHLDAVETPLMVIHGANDPRVPLSEAEQLVAALEARDVPVEFLVFDDEGHGIVKLKNKLVAYPAVVAFLDKYLRDGGAD
ncbi:MAG: alpha/beta fold hydrolase [Candidatus Promineifilaceae bacterium]|nr:alpha/beta fold hydrolase [Candidatus Promineifilaceae bacterium]